MADFPLLAMLVDPGGFHIYGAANHPRPLPSAVFLLVDASEIWAKAPKHP